MKLLREHYETYEGTAKRCRFENGLAAGEYRRGDKARLYSYEVIEVGGVWRVHRGNGATPGLPARGDCVGGGL